MRETVWVSWKETNSYFVQICVFSSAGVVRSPLSPSPLPPHTHTHTHHTNPTARGTYSGRDIFASSHPKHSSEKQANEEKGYNLVLQKA